MKLQPRYNEIVFSNEQKNIIADDYINGKTSVQIAHRCGCNHGTILKVLRKHNVDIRKGGSKRLFSSSEEKYIVREYIVNEKSAYEIASHLNCSDKCIRTVLRRNNVTLRGTGARFGIKNHYFGKHHTPEIRKKMRAAQLKLVSLGRRGDKHPAWMGGLTSLNKLIRNNDKMEVWKSAVFVRDNFTCMECHARCVVLNAHHIKPLSDMIKEHHIKTWEDALCCKELWDTDNGITLCEECHNKKRQKKGQNGKII